MTRRFWLGVIAGCYATHGETYLDSDAPLDENTMPTIWWSHGGTLHGGSPARIAFLRKLLEEMSAHAGGAGLEAPAVQYYLNASLTAAAEKAPQAVLYYMDDHQPLFYEFPLPDAEYTAELIDPWQMRVTPLPGSHSGKAKIRLNARPFQAVRFLRA